MRKQWVCWKIYGKWDIQLTTRQHAPHSTDIDSEIGFFQSPFQGLLPSRIALDCTPNESHIYISLVCLVPDCFVQSLARQRGPILRTCCSDQEIDAQLMFQSWQENLKMSHHLPVNMQNIPTPGVSFGSYPETQTFISFYIFLITSWGICLYCRNLPIQV